MQLSASYSDEDNNVRSANSSPDIRRERNTNSADVTRSLSIQHSESPEPPASFPLYYSPKHQKYGTKPCLFYMQNGYCKKGDACTFSHDVPVRCQDTTTSPQKPFVSVEKLYRTKPCKYFFETGTCRKGEHCNFSHDVHLREEYWKNKE